MQTVNINILVGRREYKSKKSNNIINESQLYDGSLNNILNIDNMFNFDLCNTYSRILINGAKRNND